MGSLQYGLYVPNFGECSYARTLAELAHEAEEAGWDGFFLFDTIVYRKSLRAPVVDSFTALAAIAMNTRRIRIGTTVTPLARRRPWKVARETVLIDHLSGGRLILGVGLGDPPDAEFEMFGEDSNNKVRAEKLDEGLDILVGLWSGEAFSYQGKHYRIDSAVFLPRPRQRPRIPIWVGGFWPNKPPFRRAARWDGVIPLKLGRTSDLWRPEPQDVRLILAYFKKLRATPAPFDIAIIGFGQLEDRNKADLINRYAEEGATWWLENVAPYRDSPEGMRARIRQGPPRTS
ncbi:MAG: LLM class flavin-dependent oxidoreductase [Armatimonadetes bacterium]|nr:LLM class flavin-dependent oxidoreductase [Armatimonadota bacterium]